MTDTQVIETLDGCIAGVAERIRDNRGGHSQVFVHREALVLANVAASLYERALLDEPRHDDRGDHAHEYLEEREAPADLHAPNTDALALVKDLPVLAFAA
jgi:hypothetical protein